MKKCSRTGCPELGKSREPFSYFRRAFLQDPLMLMDTRLYPLRIDVFSCPATENNTRWNDKISLPLLLAALCPRPSRRSVPMPRRPEDVVHHNLIAGTRAVDVRIAVRVPISSSSTSTAVTNSLIVFRPDHHIISIARTHVLLETLTKKKNCC